MGVIQVCKDTSEAVEVCEGLGFYLKPVAKLNICVQLPVLKMPGKSISNWEVMEKLRKMIQPEEFSVLKVTKTTLEFLRFEAEVENRNSLKTVISRLDSSTIKLSGFHDSLKVRAAEAKIVFPTRHDWDSYFRDAKHIDEMKPGERPDTIYIQDLPIKWFRDKYRDPNEPSENIVKQVFESFGSIRRVDIPKQDAGKDAGSIQTFCFSQDLCFEVYIQFREYMGFVKAMDALRGMKLMYKSPDGKSYITSIKVDFDKTKRLSEKNIKKRRLEKQQQKLFEHHAVKKEDEKQQQSTSAKSKPESVKKDKEKGNESSHAKESSSSSAKEERRSESSRKSDEASSKSRGHKEKRLLKSESDNDNEQRKRARLEQRCHLLKKRKQQAAWLLDELFARIKEKKEEEEYKKQLEEIERERLRQIELENRRKLEELKQKEEEERLKREKLLQQEKILREKLLRSLKVREEKRSEELREKLRKEIAGRNVLKSVLVPVHHDAPKRTHQRQRSSR